MKATWDNLFYDMRECGLTPEQFAQKAGDDIRFNLVRIEDAIREHNGAKALGIIEECKREY